MVRKRYRLRGFNSTLVQLKGYLCNVIKKTKNSFNSTLVQLKGYTLLSTRVEYPCFNSTLVQLKACVFEG